MPRAQDSEAMYYNLAKKHRSRIMQKPGARAAFARPKEKSAAGFPRNLGNPWKIKVSSTAPVHEFHVGPPGQRENHPPTLRKPCKNSYSAIAIPCRPQFWPRPLHGFPKTFKILRKINDSQRRACLAAANSKLAYLQRAVKFRGIPAENVFSTHGSFASQHNTALAGCAGDTGQKKHLVAEL